MERRKTLGLIAASGRHRRRLHGLCPPSVRRPAVPRAPQARARPRPRAATPSRWTRTSSGPRCGSRTATASRSPQTSTCRRTPGASCPPWWSAARIGAVKEQSSGLYANEFARRGYVALAFDPSFTGESGGTVRDVASPDIYTEDYSAAVDFLGLQKIVDRDRIGAQAVCGLSGMALTAAAADSRIKAVATASMYDMSRSMSRGHRDTTRVSSARRSWTTSAGSAGSTPRTAPTRGDSPTRSPSTRTATSPPQTASCPRPSRQTPTRSRRSSSTTTAPSAATTRARSSPPPRSPATTPMSFFAFPLTTNIDCWHPARPSWWPAPTRTPATTPRTSRRRPPTAADLVIVPGADHVDLYDRKDLIPFDRLDEFFTKNLA